MAANYLPYEPQQMLLLPKGFERSRKALVNARSSGIGPTLFPQSVPLSGKLPLSGRPEPAHEQDQSDIALAASVAERCSTALKFKCDSDVRFAVGTTPESL